MIVFVASLGGTSHTLLSQKCAVYYGKDFDLGCFKAYHSNEWSKILVKRISARKLANHINKKRIF